MTDKEKLEKIIKYCEEHQDYGSECNEAQVIRFVYSETLKNIKSIAK